MKYYIIAGEASGDLHGSNLMKGIYSQDPKAEIRFWGGDMMRGVCLENTGKDNLVVHYKKGAVMGITDVARNIFTIARSFSFCKKDIIAFQPDLVILIDYPGFNMRISHFCKKRGILNFYYIAPKTWASRSFRNKALRRNVDRMYIVFPFEMQYFYKQNIPYIYKGNPLLDAVDSFDIHKFPRLIEHPYVAILPGSRRAEISRMMPVCMEAVDRLTAIPQYEKYHFLIAGAPSMKESDYTAYIGDRKNVSVVFSQTYRVIRFAEAAIVNSGTASLETAILQTPQLVCWSTTPFTAFVARHIFKVLDHVKYISLANLILDRFIFKEFIQEDFTVENVVGELRRIIEDLDYRGKMMRDYFELREVMGTTGASDKIARSMIDEANLLSSSGNLG